MWNISAFKYYLCQRILLIRSRYKHLEFILVFFTLIAFISEFSIHPADFICILVMIIYDHFTQSIK